MSLDFPPPASQHPLYSQSDLDHPFSSLPNGDLSTPSHQHPPSHLPMNGHVLDRPDSMDVQDHGSYDIFSGSAQSNGRYRASSASSSVPSSYNLDNMYANQSPFSDPINQFHNPSPDPYSLMTSSYSSGKPSPLTPNDTVGGLQHSSAFTFGGGQLKDYPSSNGFTDVLDRRMSSLSTGSYPSDYNNDDYNGMSVNPGLGLGFPASSTLPPFQGRMAQDSRYPQSVIPPLSLPSHLHQNHTPDHLLHGVSPQAMHHHFREGGDLPSFMAPNPSVDFPLRMPLDDPMSRVRMGPGGATDLQTFIRCVPSSLPSQLTKRAHEPGCALPNAANTWTSMSAHRTGSRSASGR